MGQINTQVCTPAYLELNEPLRNHSSLAVMWHSIQTDFQRIGKLFCNFSAIFPLLLWSHSYEKNLFSVGYSRCTA
jgi:hypothetical protein